MLLSQLQKELESLRANVEPADAELVDLFLRRITGWKRDRTTPHELLASLDRTLENVWFSRDETHTKVYRLLEAFR
jgi:hypothetical protein